MCHIGLLELKKANWLSMIPLDLIVIFSWVNLLEEKDHYSLKSYMHDTISHGEYLVFN